MTEHTEWIDDGKRHRYWCFTLNNYTEAEIYILKQEPNVTYLVFGKEVGDSGTPHLQGYIEFKNDRAFSGLKKINKRIAWWVRRGNSKQASMYCKKGEQSHDEWSLYAEQHGGGENGPNFGQNADIYEFGKLSQKGERTDLKVVADQLLSGETNMYTIVTQNPKAYHDYGRTLEKIQMFKVYGENLSRRKLGIETQIIWIYGEAGVGKDHFAEHFPGVTEENTWKFPKGGKLADKMDYDGQKYTIISDFRGELPYDQLLTLADKWSLSFDKKYMSEKIQFVSEIIFITSPHTPWECYPNRNGKDNIRQLLRRCLSICMVPRKYSEPIECIQHPENWWVNPRPIPTQDELKIDDKNYLNSPAYTNNL